MILRSGSTISAAIVRHRPTSYTTHWAGKSLGIGDIVLCEVLQGFPAQCDFVCARTALLQLPVSALGGTDIALQCAENYRSLRRQGVTVRKTIDCLIATFVIARGFALLHNDRDFAPFEQYLGLTVVHA